MFYLLINHYYILYNQNLINFIYIRFIFRLLFIYFLAINYHYYYINHIIEFINFIINHLIFNLRINKMKNYLYNILLIVFLH